ncbi:MAG: hypoxanthine phosphoribosyltransferase [Bacteroidales bacterium]
MKIIKLHDKSFALSISESQIDTAIQGLADKINEDYKNIDSPPLFLSVLNGSFMFSANLIKRITCLCEISFVKLASYHGEYSSGKTLELIGINHILQDRHIIILEDIVDTGNTYASLMHTLQQHHPKSVKMATMLFKPDVYDKNLLVHYAAIEIPDAFIVGYGLDYNGYGRNLPEIYTVQN